MKKNYWIYPNIIIGLIILFMIGCNKKDLPVVTTSEVTNISKDTATGGGTVVDDGGADIISRGVCWSEDEDPTLDDFKTEEGKGSGSFTSNIKGLTVSTKYYVRAYATNSVGTSYGDQVSFTTSDPDPVVPTVTTTGISEVTDSSATGGGEVTDSGRAVITARGVCWGTTENPTIDDDKTIDGTGTGTFTSNLTDLSPGTTYYVRAYATNSVGTSYGAQVSFSTSAILPTITTTGITEVTTSTATGGGDISDDGGADITARGVCWNTTESPTTADDKTTDGTGVGSFTSTISALDPHTTYYVRAYATNPVGTVYGDQVSFTTLSVMPTVTTTGITEVTTSTATGGGDISDDGGADIIARGVCWSTSESPTTADDKTTDGAGTGSFTSNITGLSPGTTYYVRAYATNSIGTAYAAQVSFTTLALLPTVTTSAISDVTSYSSAGGGEVTNDGGADITARGVCWSTSESPTIADNKTTDGTGTGNFSSALTGLSGETTYYVRAYATNSVGTAYGTQVSFTTGVMVQIDASVSITKYKKNAATALSLFFDDSTPGQATYGIPAFIERNLVGTWFVNPGSSKYTSYLNVWTNAARAGGQELANHGYTHSSCSTTSCVDSEVGNAARAIWDARDEEDFASMMAWESGGGTSWPTAYLEQVLETYRCVKRLANGGEIQHGYTVYPGTEAATIIDVVNSFIGMKTWGRLHFHGITSILGDPRSTTNEVKEFPVNNGAVWTVDLYELLDTLVIDQNQGKLWIDGFTPIYKYIRERLNSSLSISQVGQDSLNIDLTTSIDPDTYNYPLTIIVSNLPDYWENCVVEQDGEANTFFTVSEGVAMIEVKPNLSAILRRVD